MDGETGDAQMKEDTQLAAAAEKAPAVQADEAAAGHPPSIAGQEPDASAADQPQADSDQPNGAASAEADAAEPGGAQAEPRADTSAAPQPEAEQGEAGSNHKEPSETQPSQEQGAEGATTEQPGQPGVEAAVAIQPEANSEPADVAMTDAAEAAPAAQPQGDEPAAKDSRKESESPVQAGESHQPTTGSAKGKRKAAPKNRKGAAAKGTSARRRSTRSQKSLNSDEEVAADEAAATAAPLTTRRSMRSRTTSHKIDPGEFVMEAEADEADEEPDSPAAGEGPQGALEDGDKRAGSEDRGVSVAVGLANAVEAGAIACGHRTKSGSAEGTPPAAVDSAGAATESKGDSEDNVPLLQLVGSPAKKKRQAAGAPGASAAASKRQKSDAKPAADVKPVADAKTAAAAEQPLPAASGKARPAVKRGKKQPDQAPTDREPSPALAAAAGKPAQKPPAEDIANAGAPTPKQPPPPPTKLQKQQQTAAQQPKQQQKPKQLAAAAAEAAQGKEGAKGKKEGEPSLDATTMQAKQIAAEMHKALAEFQATQKTQADIAKRVQSYLGHLDNMHISIPQLRDSMVGRSVKKISKWALDATCQEAATHARKLLGIWMSEVEDEKVAPAKDKGKLQQGKAPIKATARKLLGIWMSEVEDEKVAPAKDKGKPQQGSKAGTAAAPRPLAQEQKAKSQGPPAAEAKPSVTAVTAIPNAVGLRTGGLGAAGAPASKDPAAASTAGPTASKKLQEARDWCSQHLTPHPTGNAVRDQAQLILWSALMPDGELPPAEAARKLEAAVHEQYARGNGDNAVADPSHHYMRRMRVLWGWLSPDSKHAEPQLKHMLLQGELAAAELASMSGQQLKALVNPPAAAAEGRLAPDNAATTSADASHRDVQMDVDRPSQAPALLSPADRPVPAAQDSSEPARMLAEHPFASTQPSSELAKPPGADKGQQDVPQQQQQQQQQQQSEAAEVIDHTSDMEIDEAPGSLSAPADNQQQPSSAAAPPRPKAGLTKEPSLHMWGANNEASLGSWAHQAPPKPAPCERASGTAAADSGTSPAEAAVSGAEQHSAASEQLPAVAEQPPPPPAQEVPDLAAAAAAAAANSAQQPEPATPAGSPGTAKGTFPRGWQSAPPVSDEKSVFDSGQGVQFFNSKAGVLFEWNGPGGAAHLPGGQGSEPEATQPSTTADGNAVSDAEMKIEGDVVAE